MSRFPKKQFEGQTYTFDHLSPKTMIVGIGNPPVNISLHVTFGCHCFTEEFKEGEHGDHHRYTYKGELRAFDTIRYACSLNLPDVVLPAMLNGLIYNAEKSLTFVSHITLPTENGQQDYSIFFSLEKDRSSTHPAVRMFVKSAYLKSLAAVPGAQNWRFKGLIADVSQAFPPKPKGAKPKKKRK